MHNRPVNPLINSTNPRAVPKQEPESDSMPCIDWAKSSQHFNPNRIGSCVYIRENNLRRNIGTCVYVHVYAHVHGYMYILAHIISSSITIKLNKSIQGNVMPEGVHNKCCNP